jgi:hypothetical protein
MEHWIGFSNTVSPSKISGGSATLSPIKGLFGYLSFALRPVPSHPDTNCQLEWRKFHFLSHWKQEMCPASSISVLSTLITTITPFAREYFTYNWERADEFCVAVQDCDRRRHFAKMGWSMLEFTTDGLCFVWNRNNDKGQSVWNIVRFLGIKKTQWLESASELYRPSDRRFSEKLVPTFEDRGCNVPSAADPLRL